MPIRISDWKEAPMMNKDDILPFNACDYRCDRCDRTAECRLFKREQAQRLRHILCGEDPDNPEIVFADIHDSFQEMNAMLMEKASELGIDLDLDSAGREDEREERSLKENPLYQKARDFAVKAFAFIKECKEKLIVTPEIKPFFDEIHWYAPLIAAKTARALSGLGGPHEVREDVEATAGVIRDGLKRCRTAFSQLALYRPESRELSTPLSTLTSEIEKGLREALRGSRLDE